MVKFIQKQSLNIVIVIFIMIAGAIFFVQKLTLKEVQRTENSVLIRQEVAISYNQSKQPSITRQIEKKEFHEIQSSDSSNISTKTSNSKSKTSQKVFYEKPSHDRFLVQ